MGFSIGSVFKEATNALDDTLAIAKTAKSVAEIAGVKTIASDSPMGSFASILVDALASQNQDQANLALNKDLFPVALGQGLSKTSPKLAEDYEEELERLRSNPESTTNSKELSVQAITNLVAQGKLTENDSEDIIEKVSTTTDSNTYGYQEFAKNPLVATSKVGSALFESYTSFKNIKNMLSW